jgi:DNA-binding NarL/FixJ family response regulator
MLKEPLHPSNGKHAKALFQNWLHLALRINKLEMDLSATRKAELEARKLILAEIKIGSEMLSKREIEVLAEIQKGSSNKEIAYNLQIAERTAKYHVSSILKKLSRTSRHDL